MSRKSTKGRDQAENPSFRRCEYVNGCRKKGITEFEGRFYCPQHVGDAYSRKITPEMVEMASDGFKVIQSVYNKEKGAEEALRAFFDKWGLEGAERQITKIERSDPVEVGFDFSGGSLDPDDPPKAKERRKTWPSKTAEEQIEEARRKKIL